MAYAYFKQNDNSIFKIPLQTSYSYYINTCVNKIQQFDISDVGNVIVNNVFDHHIDKEDRLFYWDGLEWKRFLNVDEVYNIVQNFDTLTISVSGDGKFIFIPGADKLYVFRCFPPYLYHTGTIYIPEEFIPEGSSPYFINTKVIADKNFVSFLVGNTLCFFYFTDNFAYSDPSIHIDVSSGYENHDFTIDLNGSIHTVISRIGSFNKGHIDYYINHTLTQTLSGTTDYQFFGAKTFIDYTPNAELFLIVQSFYSSTNGRINLYFHNGSFFQEYLQINGGSDVNLTNYILKYSKYGTYLATDIQLYVENYPESIKKITISNYYNYTIKSIYLPSSFVLSKITKDAFVLQHLATPDAIMLMKRI